jgi:type IV secretory pathway VirB10-like protein
MRSRPQKQIEQEIEDEDENIAVDVKNDSSSISASKKNTMLIILASVILIFVCYYIFLSGDDPNNKVLEQVPQPLPDVIENSPGENVAPKEKEEDKSIYDLSDVDQKEKSNVELLEKQAKPEIPDIPELPNDISPDLIDLTKIKDEQSKEGDAKVNPILPDGAPDSEKSNQNIITASSEELKLRDKKIQDLELKLKEQQENQEKQRQSLLDEAKKKEESDKIAKEKQEQMQKAQDSIFEPRYSPIVVFSDRGGAATPPLGVGQEKNIISLKEDSINKIQKTDKNVEVRMIEDRARTIAQGKLLTAILETSINTEFPGAVRGIITRDVYGEAGKEVLIPKGSRLYGSYSSAVKRGQGRVDISWSRLIRPDGISLNIALSAADQFGRAGIPGETDNRYSSLVANSLLTSVLAVAGTAAAQEIMGGNSQTSTTINAAQGTTTTYGNAGNQALYDVTKTVIDIVTGIIKNTIDLNPVIRIPQGARMTVIVNSDIVVPYMRKK